MAQPGFDLFSSLRWDPQLLHSEDNTKLSGPAGQPSPFYMLEYHRDRMLQAATNFNWPVAVSKLQGDSGLELLNSTLSKNVQAYYADGKTQTPLRIRTLLTDTGAYAVEFGPTPPVSMEQLYPAGLSKQGHGFRPSGNTGGALTVGRDTVLIRGPEGSPYTQPWRLYPDIVATSPSPFTISKTTQRNMYNEARRRLNIENMNDQAEVILWNPAGEIMEGSLTSVYFFRNGRWVTPPISSGGQNGTTRRWLLERGMCEEEIVHVSSLQQGEDCYISNGVRGLIWCTVDLPRGRESNQQAASAV